MKFGKAAASLAGIAEEVSYDTILRQHWERSRGFESTNITKARKKGRRTWNYKRNKYKGRLSR